MDITIQIGQRWFHAELDDSATARLIASALPLTAIVNRWGQEIYFHIPVHAAPEPDARAQVRVGELGYWPDGAAFCIFFGPTPASRGDQPVAASPVNVIGRLIEPVDVAALDAIEPGTKVTLSI